MTGVSSNALTNAETFGDFTNQMLKSSEVKNNASKVAEIIPAVVQLTTGVSKLTQLLKQTKEKCLFYLLVKPQQDKVKGS